MITMGLATTEPEREAVFRFWYSVYVEEMDRYRDIADHPSRTLRGPEDERSLIFYACEDDEVVAACRWSWGAQGFTDRQIAQYQLEPFLREVPPEVIIVGERTMVAASHRGTSVYTDLGWQTEALAEAAGVVVRPWLAFGASEPHLVSYYAQFEQLPYAARQSWSDETGYIVPTIKFTRGVEVFGDDPPSCIRAAQAGSSSVRNEAADGVEIYTAALHDAVGEEPRGVFAGMSSDEIDRIAARATLLRCASGDQILRRGGTARNPFVVTSGHVDAQGGDGRALRLGPGDLFGESGWLAGDRRRADVVVVDEATLVLALSERVLRTLGDTEPALAERLHANVDAQLRTRLADGGGVAT